METFLNGPNLVIMGLLIWAGMMWRNSAANGGQLDSHNPRSEERSLPPAFDLDSQIRDLQTRLNDFDRDLSARVETALDLLDQVIAEADREIDRLEAMLAKRQAECETPGTVVHSSGTGYSKIEFEKCVDSRINPPDYWAA